MIQYKTTLLLRAVDKANNETSQEMGPQNRAMKFLNKLEEEGFAVPIPH